MLHHEPPAVRAAKILESHFGIEEKHKKPSAKNSSEPSEEEINRTLNEIKRLSNRGEA